MPRLSDVASNVVTVVARADLDSDGKKGIKIVVPAVIGGIFAFAFFCVVLIWLITKCRMRKSEKKFWAKAEARNTLRQSRAMALAEQGSLATRDSVATLSTLASGVSGPQVYNSTLLPHAPSERSLRASMMSMNSSYSSPYDSSPLAISARRNSSLPEDPWDTRSDVDPSEAVPMLGNRSPRPSLSIDTGASKPPAYGKTYVSSTEYPPSGSGQYAAVASDDTTAAGAQLEGHDYEYAQAAAAAAAAVAAAEEAARADDTQSMGHRSVNSLHEVAHGDGGHVRSTIVQVGDPSPAVRKQSVPVEVGQAS